MLIVTTAVSLQLFCFLYEDPNATKRTSSSSSSSTLPAAIKSFDLFDDFVRAFMTMFQILTNEGEQ